MTTTTTDKKTKNRRGKGEGSITQRQDGLWMARIGIGRDPTSGKRLTKTFYGKSKKEVGDKLTGEASALLTGTSVNSGKMTVADLLKKWLDEDAKPNCSPGTVAEYKRIVDSHLVPKIGPLKLANLRPLHIQTMLTTMEKTVGARTRQYCYVTLRRAFTIAMRWHLLVRNPCDGVTPPKVTKRPVKPLTADQAKTLLEKAKGTRFEALYVLALTTGMRQGELFGLSWDDVDLKAGILQVRHSLENVNNALRLKEPKSESGKRQLALPKLAVDALKTRQAAAMKEGLAGCSMVFPDQDGGYLRRSNFLKWSWFKIRTAAGLDGVHFHDLRHSSASLMLADGVHMKSIQTILGHSTISMTMDTYAHLMPDSQRQAAATFDRLLG